MTDTFKVGSVMRVHLRVNRHTARPFLVVENTEHRPGRSIERIVYRLAHALAGDARIGSASICFDAPDGRIWLEGVNGDRIENDAFYGALDRAARNVSDGGES
jgi:hypothetical protein